MFYSFLTVSLCAILYCFMLCAETFQSPSPSESSWDALQPCSHTHGSANGGQTSTLTNSVLAAMGCVIVLRATTVLHITASLDKRVWLPFMKWQYVFTHTENNINIHPHNDVMATGGLPLKGVWISSVRALIHWEYISTVTRKQRHYDCSISEHLSAQFPASGNVMNIFSVLRYRF